MHGLAAMAMNAPIQGLGSLCSCLIRIDRGLQVGTAACIKTKGSSTFVQCFLGPVLGASLQYAPAPPSLLVQEPYTLNQEPPYRHSACWVRRC